MATYEPTFSILCHLLIYLQQSVKQLINKKNDKDHNKHVEVFLHTTYLPKYIGTMIARILWDNQDTV